VKVAMLTAAAASACHPSLLGTASSASSRLSASPGALRERYGGELLSRVYRRGRWRVGEACMLRDRRS